MESPTPKSAPLPDNAGRAQWKTRDRWRRIMECSMRKTMQTQLDTIAVSAMPHPANPTTPTMPVAPDDAELIALGQALHAAARRADEQIQAMPEDLTVDEETAGIEAILKPGDAIAQRMLERKPETPEGIDALIRAGLWKTGDYIDTYLKGRLRAAESDAFRMPG